MASEETTGGAGSVAQATEPLSLDVIRAQTAELLGEAPAAIGDDDNLLDRGLDSIRIMTLVEQWHRYGVEATVVELAEQPTVTAWWTLASSRLSVGANSGSPA